MQTQFKNLELGSKFKHGKSTYIKAYDPFTATCLGGVRVAKSYTWKAFEENKLVEKLCQ